MDHHLAKPIIAVTNGILKVDPRYSCDIHVGFETIKNATGILEDLYFGKILYNCSNLDSGTIISKEDCAECGLFCPYNELFEKCRKTQIFLPVLFASLALLLLGSLFVLLFCCFKPQIKYIVDHIAYYFNYKRQLKSDRNEIKGRCRGGNDKYEVENKYELTLPYRKKVLGKRCELSHNIAKKVLVTGLLASSVGGNMANDIAIYLKSDSAICMLHDGVCNTVPVVQIDLESGKQITFFNNLERVFTIKLKDFGQYHRYVPMYETSEYTIRTNSSVQCKGHPDCYDGKCNINTKLAKLVNKTTEEHYVHKYGCGDTTLQCEGVTCPWYGTSSCVHYSVYAVPTGPSAIVYKERSSGWYATIEYVYNDHLYTSYVTASNPAFFLRTFMDIAKEISLQFQEPTFEKQRVTESLLNEREVFYHVHASPLDHPAIEFVGDFQFNLGQKPIYTTTNYPLFDINCLVASCDVHCEVPVSQLKITRDKIKKGDLKPVEKYEKVGNTVIVKKRANGQIPVKIGNLKFSHTAAAPGECEINIIEKYSCIGCTKMPYIMYQSIANRDGVMQIKSNCSFTRPYLSCGPEYYYLEYENFEEYCMIFIPSKNITLHIENIPIFEGKVSFQHSRGSVAIGGVNTGISIFSSKTFMDSLNGGMMIMGIASILAPIVMLLQRCMFLYCTNRQFQRTTQHLI